jgi:hypothetical protein
LVLLLVNLHHALTGHPIDARPEYSQRAHFWRE